MTISLSHLFFKETFEIATMSSAIYIKEKVLKNNNTAVEKGKTVDIEKRSNEV